MAHQLGGAAMVKCIITIRPGPVLHVWRDGSQVAAIPMTPRAALTIAQDLIRLATENVQ